MSVKRKLIRNTVFSIGMRYWNQIITLILTPIIIYYIGIAEYGVYILVGALTGYFSLLDLGIGTSVVKFIAQYHAKGEKEKVNEIVNTAYFLFLGVGVVGAIGIFIMGTFVIGIFNLDGELLWKARLLTYILAAGFIMSFSMALFGDVLRGMQRYDIVAYISFGVSLVALPVTLIVLLMGYGIVELILYTMVFGLIGRIITAYYAKKILPYLDIKVRHVNKTRIRSLFSLSMILLVLFAFNKIIFYTDALVIGLFLSVSMVTFYAVAQKISSIPRSSLNATMHAMIPAASELDALQQKRTLQRLFLRVLKYNLALLFMLSIPTIFLARHILKYWIGWTGAGFQFYYCLN